MEFYKRMFARIETIALDERINLCQRLKILLINLKEDRSNDWEK